MDAEGKRWAVLINLHLCLLPSAHHNYYLICSSPGCWASFPPMRSTGKRLKVGRGEIGIFPPRSLPAPGLHFWQWMHFFSLQVTSFSRHQLVWCFENTSFPRAFFPGQVLWETDSDTLSVEGLLRSECLGLLLGVGK